MNFIMIGLPVLLTEALDRLRVRLNIGLSCSTYKCKVIGVTHAEEFCTGNSYMQEDYIYQFQKVKPKQHNRNETAAALVLIKF